MVLHAAAAALDWAMDKSLVLGYTKIGPAVRRAWWPHDPVPGALVGRHVLVTGASGGLGLATARGLAHLGAVVHITGRDASRLDDARTRLLEEQPLAEVTAHVADVSDLAATAEFARRFVAEVPRLHAVVHNAGVMPPRRTVTPEGHEPDPGHPRARPARAHLRAPRVARRGRVVLVTSGGAYGQRLDVDDWEYASGDYSGVTAYARTKRMRLVLTEPVGARPRVRRHPRPLDAPRLGRHPGRHRLAPSFRRAHGSAAARRRRGRRHRGVAHGDRRRHRHRGLLARPAPARDALRARRGRDAGAGGAALGGSFARRPGCRRRAPEPAGRHPSSAARQGRSQQVHRSMRR